MQPFDSPARQSCSFADTATDSTASGHGEPCHSPPITDSPSSTRSRIAPSRFSSLARYWNQRALGNESSPPPLADADSTVAGRVQAANSPCPAADGVLSGSSQRAAGRSQGSRSSAGDWSPPRFGHFGPSPRRLWNYLEDGFSPEGDPSGESAAPRTPCRLRRFTSTPSTASSLVASSRASVMSIATPEKLVLGSPVGSQWCGESEMELALDLANHVPCNMMDRLTDMLNASKASPVFEDEILAPETPRFGVATDPKPLSSSLLRRALLGIVAMATLGIVFVAGFVAHDVWLASGGHHGIWGVASRRFFNAASGQERAAEVENNARSNTAPLGTLSNSSVHTVLVSMRSYGYCNASVQLKVPDVFGHSPSRLLTFPLARAHGQVKHAVPDIRPRVQLKPRQGSGEVEKNHRSQGHAVARQRNRIQMISSRRHIRPHSWRGKGQLSVPHPRTQSAPQQLGKLVNKSVDVLERSGVVEYSSGWSAATKWINGTEIEQSCLMAVQTSRAIGMVTGASDGELFAEEACHAAARGVKSRARAS